MDPPYDKELERRVLEYLTMSKLIHEDTLIIFEASLDTDISYLEDLGYELIKEKKYKTNKHVFVQRSKR
jgi:16S rRNA (guanine966-N2)-methyltransferase